MAQSKREKYEHDRQVLRELAESGDVASDDVDEILQWCDGYDPEKATSTPANADDETNRWGDSRKPATLRNWLRSMSAFARDLDCSILEADADEFNQAAQRMYEGDAASVTKPLSKNSVRARQNCLKKFLRHLDNGVDPSDIAVFDQQSTAVDPEDMLTRDEFHALRNAPEHPRDKTIVDLFLYTGQRNAAIRTLRIKDVDVDQGRYRLNDTADGLKGAELIGTWNPLLGANGTVRDWLNHHPDSENGDAYLLCECRDSLIRDASETISDDTVNRVLRKAADKAAQEEPGIENKPTHAHALRHNFVTICKRDHDMKDETIKRLIRHKPQSDVMNTTYAHLSDEDYINRARRAFGYEDEEEESESPMTPQDNCDVCNEPLKPDAKACPNCGEVFHPDAKIYERQAQEYIPEIQNETEAQIVNNVLQDVRDNPDEYL